MVWEIGFCLNIPVVKWKKRADKPPLMQANRAFEIRGFAGEPENGLENASIVGENRTNSRWGKWKIPNPNGIRSMHIANWGEGIKYRQIVMCTCCH